MSTQITLTARGLKKVFNRRVIFDDITFSVGPSQTLLVSGRNGSGKSTLMKIVAGVLEPSAGSVSIGGTEGTGEWAKLHTTGLVSPYLNLYDEFTAEENLRIAMAIRGLAFPGAVANDLLKRVGLFHRKDDPVRTYSSGMKQRAKYAFALIHRPAILLLDEPMSNLDTEGIGAVREIMEDHRRSGLLVVATNDLTDVDRWDGKVDLNAGR